MDTNDRPLAVVTGASSGIGLELAREFARHGFDLVVVAEDSELTSVPEELGAFDVDVQALQIDLAADDGVDEFYGRLVATGRPVDALALNAGIGAGGSFAGPGSDQTDLQDELRLIDINVRSTVHLAKHVVSDMVAR